ncbi:hypothetical protein JG688_00012480 [Phytophthora aleatoria]|uniref:Ankyrin repeat-containing domain n=1 Tax=Phytophthora aleatoria TaxID=2496075 RepID=A0A8J5IPY4_9STRA|nr:hypothetical protein JG688_00012480 [Phytophthora aleatoria]
METCKWRNSYIAIELRGAGRAAMDLAAEMGHLKVVKWLHENRTKGCTVAAMTYAAERGNLEVVQWLRKNRDEGCPSTLLV